VVQINIFARQFNVFNVTHKLLQLSTNYHAQESSLTTFEQIEMIYADDFKHSTH